MSVLFTDLYQLTMARAYFEANKHKDHAVFEGFFRRCPFKGEFAIFGGFDLLKKILDEFHLSSEDLKYLRSLPAFSNASETFFDELKALHLKDIQILAMQEGEVVFAKEPLIQIRGPLMKIQLLESSVLNALNFATLVATCAHRIKLVAKNKSLVEFGLRRAQGPNGAMTASRSSFLGGFDATSNVQAGMDLGIPVVGTMAHSFVQSFVSGELDAFMAYASSFPDTALLLVDTYDTLRSGLPNAIKTFECLRKNGHKPAGIRLDSGDLVYLSKAARKMLNEAGFSEAQIFASNDLDEKTIESLEEQGSCIDAYGVGTQLVTSAGQPALGGVFKLVELNGHPRMKISQQTDKLVLPAAKNVYRFFGKDHEMLIDVMSAASEQAPLAGKEIEALHPSDPFKKAVVIPSQVESLLKPLFENGKWLDSRTLSEKRQFSSQRMSQVRSDIKRPHNPAPYKVSITQRLKSLTDALYLKESPPAVLE